MVLVRAEETIGRDRGGGRGEAGERDGLKGYTGARGRRVGEEARTKGREGVDQPASKQPVSLRLLWALEPALGATAAVYNQRHLGNQGNDQGAAPGSERTGHVSWLAVQKAWMAMASG